RPRTRYGLRSPRARAARSPPGHRLTSPAVATLMDGKTLAERIRAEVKQEIAELGELGLATILVGDDPASEIYIRRKHEAASEVGIRSHDLRLPAETAEEELLERVAALNADES